MSHFITSLKHIKNGYSVVIKTDKKDLEYSEYVAWHMLKIMFPLINYYICVKSKYDEKLFCIYLNKQKICELIDIREIEPELKILSDTFDVYRRFDHSDKYIVEMKKIE